MPDDPNQPPVDQTSPSEPKPEEKPEVNIEEEVKKQLDEKVSELLQKANERRKERRENNLNQVVELARKGLAQVVIYQHKKPFWQDMPVLTFSRTFTNYVLPSFLKLLNYIKNRVKVQPLLYFARIKLWIHL